ncbi:fas-binding factor 1 [Spea bombifrons]|uniref:fas-binding factor 1 n=1 Tax=Spea bombifrons TaxID=233779 RepID=UPI00234A6080|nr:fas-binding factor 1 [Spea bombifrons]
MVSFKLGTALQTRDSIDDVLGDLLGDDDFSPPNQRKASPSTSAPSILPRSNILPKANKKSPLDDTFFSELAKEVTEDFDISEADAQALLEDMKDLDDMDEEIFGGKKPKPAPAKNSAINQSTEQKPKEKTLEPRRGHSATESEKKPLSSAVGLSQSQKFAFDDLDDPLAGILSDEDDGSSKNTKPTGYRLPHDPTPMKTEEAALPSPARPSSSSRRRDELIFEDDSDDIMDALGFGDAPQKGESSTTRPARSKLDELLGRGTSAKLLERPLTGEQKEFKLDPKYTKQPEKEDIFGDEEIAFGSYKPTVMSSPDSRRSRHSSIRLSAENNSILKSDAKSQPTTPVSPSPAKGERNGADWLGLKDDVLDVFPVREPTRTSSATPTGLHQSGTKTANGPAIQTQASHSEEPGVPQENDEWLTAALSRKKAQQLDKGEVNQKGQNRSVQKDAGSRQLEEPGVPQENDDWLSAALSRKKAQQQEKGEVSQKVHNHSIQTDVASSSAKETQKTIVPNTMKPSVSSSAAEVSGSPFPSVVSTSRQEITPKAPSSVPSESRRAEMEQLIPTRSVERVKEDDRGHKELQDAMNRIADLEAQVRRLQLEKEQQALLLETLRERHKEDLELVESTHRQRLKLLEDCARQREERLCQENKELSEQHLSYCQNAEQEKADMWTQCQKKLSEFHQEKEVEVEGIKQLHRSLNCVIEQMGTFTQKLGVLSEKVDNTKLSASQEPEKGMWQGERQLQGLQKLLSDQNREMEEEWNSLRMVITSMETRLTEQSRLLEQNALMEERHRSYMMRFAEEEKKLKTEWSELHAQQRLNKERSYKHEQAELKIQASEQQLREQQLALARERQELEEERLVLRLEKERVNASALRLQHRTEEVESMSRLASQLCEKGEKTLAEARRVESQHLSRLKTIQQNLDWLRNREEYIHQERLNLDNQRCQLNKLRQALPTTSSLPVPGIQGISAMGNPQTQKYNRVMQEAAFETKVALFKISAHQDKDFLANEQHYLDNLKKSSLTWPQTM